MPYTHITRRIDAPIELVFATVADVRKFSQAIPHIEKVEFLSETQAGVGTRFRETRNMGGKSATTELEVTEYVANERVRVVADSHGTVWDSVFTVRPIEGGTELELVMEARAHSLLAKATTPLARGMISKAIAHDLDAVKTYCEGVAAATA